MVEEWADLAPASSKRKDTPSDAETVVELRNELLAAEEWAGYILPLLEQLRSESTQQCSELSMLKLEVDEWKEKAETYSKEHIRANARGDIDSTQDGSENGTLDALRQELADAQAELADSRATITRQETEMKEVEMSLTSCRSELQTAQEREKKVLSSLHTAEAREKTLEAGLEREQTVKDREPAVEKREKTVKDREPAVETRGMSDAQVLQAGQERETARKELAELKNSAQKAESWKQKALAGERNIAKKHVMVQQLKSDNKKMEEEKIELRKSVADAEKESKTLKSKAKLLDDELWQISQNESSLLENLQREATAQVRAETASKVSELHDQVKELEQQLTQLRNRRPLNEKEPKSDKKKNRFGKKSKKATELELDSQLFECPRNTWMSLSKAKAIYALRGVAVALLVACVLGYAKMW